MMREEALGWPAHERRQLRQRKGGWGDLAEHLMGQ